jgi:phosphoglycerate dehydrogenase-like enzyme
MSLKVFYPREVLTLYPRDVDQSAWDILHKVLDPEIKFIIQPNIPDPADYQVLVSGRPTEDLLEASQNLHTVVIPWAGLPEQTGALMRKYPHISLHNLHHNAVTTAETALTLLLAAAKCTFPIERAFRQHDWRPRYGPNPARLLYGKTILIFGYGSIGQHIGRVCQTLGMKIVAIRRNPDKPGPEDVQAELYSPEALHQFLPLVDVLMVTVPLTDETRGRIGEREFELMPEGAILVNVGRGLVIDQEALYEALKSGKLHSAGIDVWYNYPSDEDSRANTPPADYPFHELENIVMSPHRGGGASEVEFLRMQKLAEMLNAIARGELVPNKVDLEAGY